MLITQELKIVTARDLICYRHIKVVYQDRLLGQGSISSHNHFLKICTGGQIYDDGLTFTPNLEFPYHLSVKIVMYSFIVRNLVLNYVDFAPILPLKGCRSSQKDVFKVMLPKRNLVILCLLFARLFVVYSYYLLFGQLPIALFELPKLRLLSTFLFSILALGRIV